MRLRISARLRESQSTAASLTTFNEVDVSSLIAPRAKYKDQIPKDQGTELGVMSAFARASVLVLKETPAANPSIELRATDRRPRLRRFERRGCDAQGPGHADAEECGENGVHGYRDGIANLGKKAGDSKLTI